LDGADYFQHPTKSSALKNDPKKTFVENLHLIKEINRAAQRSAGRNYRL
jgi:hypothetical protein